MVIDIDKSSEGEWFTFFESRIGEDGKVVYDEPKKDAGRVCIRSIVPFIEEKQGQRKRKYEFVLNPVARSMERVGYYDEIPPEQAKQEQADLWDYAITGLEGFYDKNHKEITCTRENKVKLMKLSVFDRFVARCLQLLGSATAEAKEAEEKNSQAG
jgi:hypothetical protein